MQTLTRSGGYAPQTPAIFAEFLCKRSVRRVEADHAADDGTQEITERITEIRRRDMNTLIADFHETFRPTRTA